MPLKIKPNLKSVANLEELVSRTRFMFLGKNGIFHLVKYCFILQKKNANYRTPLKMSIRLAVMASLLSSCVET